VFAAAGDKSTQLSLGVGPEKFGLLVRISIHNRAVKVGRRFVQLLPGACGEFKFALSKFISHSIWALAKDESCVSCLVRVPVRERDRRRDTRVPLLLVLVYPECSRFAELWPIARTLDISSRA
jgi:hypothetical protein